MAVQRVRVKYGRSDALQFVSHLDMMRLWERAFRRAGLPLAYSEGHLPRPRLSIAAALPVGVTSETELLDVYLNRRVSPFYFLKQLEPQLPEGIRTHEALDAPMDWPSLQSQVREAEYHVTVSTEASGQAIQEALEAFLDRKSVPWEHRRDKEVRRYDLRELVHDLWLVKAETGMATIGMLLKTDPSASGRPEQVAAALGIGAKVTSVHRARLTLAELAPRQAGVAPAGRRR